MLLRQLFEALNQQQKDYLDSQLEAGEFKYDPTRYDDIFGVGQSRIYLPMPETVRPNEQVIQTLEQLGYKVTNYRAGLAVLAQPKQYDIRRVLGKNPDLLNAWETDPYKTDPTQLAVTSQVTNALRQYGYSIVDYNNGILTRENKPESIGSILQKHKVDPEIIKGFAHDPVRISSTQDTESDAEELNTNNQVIVITRDKYEAAEVGTNKRWQSCLNLGGGWEGVDKTGRARGSNAQYLVKDVAIGAIAAYLINKNDTELDDPIARLSIKPFINKADPNNTQVALGVHDKVYHREGRPFPEAFKTIVHNWANEINASKELEGMFSLHPEAYNFDEFKYDNTKQYHGSYKTDMETFKTYGNKIRQVPDELRTIGYLKIVANERPEMWEDLIPYAKNISDVITLTKISSRGYDWAVYFPYELIIQDPKAYFDLLDEMSKQSDTLFNQMGRNNTEMIDKLYTLDKKRFLQACQISLNNHKGYNNPLTYLIRNTSNVELLNDILTLNGLSEGPMTEALEHLLDTRAEIDKDVLIKLVNNPRSSAWIISKVADYAMNSDIPEVEVALENRTHVLSKTIIDEIENITSPGMLDDVLNLIYKIQDEVELDKKVYIKLLSCDQINRHNIDDVVKIAYISGNEEIVYNFIKNRNLSIYELGMISDRFDLDDDGFNGIMNDKWNSVVKQATDNEDIGTIVRSCRNPSVIIKLLKQMPNGSISSYNLSYIIEKIEFDEYRGDISELVKTVLPRIGPYDSDQLFELVGVLKRKLNSDDYDMIQAGLNKQIFNQLSNREFTTSELRNYITKIDYNNKPLFKELLNVITSDEHYIRGISEILENIKNRYKEKNADELYKLVLPQFTAAVKDDIISQGTLYNIYELELDPFTSIIVKHYKTFQPLFLLPERTDSPELVKIKTEKLIAAANDPDLNERFVGLIKGELPLEVEEVLLKNAIKDNDYRMIDELLRSSYNQPIKDSIEKYLSSRTHQTLNAALESKDLVDLWPMGKALNYGEDAKVPVDGGMIHIKRFSNGTYSDPEFIKSEPEEVIEPEVSTSKKLQELVKKGKEAGFITYQELANILDPTEFDPDQIDDIITMMGAMGIQVLEGLSESIDRMLVNFIDNI